jgi:predicted transcriptional regulator
MFTSTIDVEYRKKLEMFSNLQNERKRRDRLYIISEILTIAKGRCLKTQIMYRANLSFAQLNEYLSFLIKMDLLKVKNENRRNTYRTTAKGDKYLEKYKDLANLLGNNERNPCSQSNGSTLNRFS